MNFHDFERNDPETRFWTNVMPGDLVRSPGTHAIMVKDFYKYCYGTFKERDNVGILTLANGPLLVIAKIFGCPNMKLWSMYVTFVVISRHGLLVVLQSKNSNNEKITSKSPNCSTRSIMDMEG